MDRKEQTQVSLVVQGTEVDPVEVGRALALQPEWAHKAGDIHPNGKDRWPYGSCSFTSHVGVSREAAFEEHAHWLIDRLSQHTAILAAWRAGGSRVQLNVTTVTESNNGGPVVSEQILRGLADLGLPVRFRTICAPNHSGFKGPPQGDESSRPRTTEG
jgi:hypothetical protein